MSNMKAALASGDSRQVMAALKAGNRKRAQAQAARCKAASLEALEEMYGCNCGISGPVQCDLHGPRE